MYQLAQHIETTLKVGVLSDKEGKQLGFLDIPSPSNRSAWGVIRVPFAVIQRGEGPTALLTAGVHGDEYEGQIALNRLVHELDAKHIKGRVIILPSVNIQGAYEATRLTPVGLQDSNRLYPGKVEGTPAERLVHFIAHALVPAADVVLDFHSGGYSLDFLPCGVIHDSANQQTRQQRFNLLKAFGAPYNLVLEELDGKGMLDTFVENQGKLFLSTELGGGQRVTSKTVKIAIDGVANTLREIGVLQHQSDKLARASEVDNDVFYQLPAAGYCMALEEGIFEPFYDLGQWVKQGDVVGQVHAIRSPLNAPTPICAQCDGLVFGKRSPAMTQLGDTLMLIAQEY